MSEMIERVAAALRGFEAGWLLDTGSVNPSGKAYETARAHAAIAAMREPTAAQERKMEEVLGLNTPPTRRWHWVWQEMIDAAFT